jgi:hypothetical protein
MPPKPLAIVPKQKPNALPPLGNRSERTPELLAREIAAAEAGLERANKDFWKASRCIARDGVCITKTVTDSKGYAFKKRGVNSMLRVLAAAERAMKIYKDTLEDLRAELAALTRPKVSKDATDNFFDEGDNE